MDVTWCLEGVPVNSQQPANTRRRNPRGQGQLLRAQLIDAAANLLATLERPETLTLRQVAREVGVAPASIYSHFPSLGALIEHVLRLRYEELSRLMNEAATAASDPLADLVDRCAAYVRWGIDQPGHYRTLFGGRMPADLVPDSAHGAGAGLLESVVTSLSAATSTRRRRSTANERWQAGLMLWTGMHGLISLYNDHGSISWPPLDDLIVDLIGLHTGRSAGDIAAALGAQVGS